MNLSLGFRQSCDQSDGNLGLSMGRGECVQGATIGKPLSWMTDIMNETNSILSAGKKKTT